MINDRDMAIAGLRAGMIKYSNLGNLLEIDDQLKDGIVAAVRWAHDQAVKFGEWKEERDTPDLFAHMHKELSKAFHAHQTDAWDDQLHSRKGVEVKLADLLIRLFDYVGSLGPDAGAMLAIQVTDMGEWKDPVSEMLFFGRKVATMHARLCIALELFQQADVGAFRAAASVVIGIFAMAAADEHDIAGAFEEKVNIKWLFEVDQIK